MHNQLLNNEGRKPRRFVRRWMAGLLACVMGISTSVALAPSAFAQEETEQKETSAYTCGLEEHTHTEECYEKVTTRTEKVLSCTLATQPAAAGEEAVVIVHKHDASCYDAAGALVCALTEREAHTHTDACYGAPVLHVHSESCYETSETPVCGLEETEGHTHTDECSGKPLSCELHVCDESCADPCTVEQDPHVHTDECYQEKVCNLEAAEAHTHTEDCYKKLICGKTEDTVESKGEPTCGKEELILHSHSVDNQCYLLTYDPNGTIATKELNCQTPVVEEHIHTDACFTTREIPAADVDTLTCGKEESGEHTHTGRCHGTWELTCGLEEHTHVDECEKVEEVNDVIDDYVEYGEQPVGTAWLSSLGSKSSSYYMEEREDDDFEQSGTQAEVFSLPKRARVSSPQMENVGQIYDDGGESAAENGNVNISKKIAGTNIENVFDITLTVSTKENIQTIISDPDMAVVLVMDMSATMMSDFSGSSGETTKYGVATSAAKNFVQKFAQNTTGTSQIGFVTFNTHAQQVCSMTSVSTEKKVTEFNQTMQSGIDSIVNEYKESLKDGSITSNERYTNIQAGLQAAQNMLNCVNNKNKFVVFLSDGLPTTYENYVPISSDGTIGEDGVFYDSISTNGEYCRYGTNYSDKGAQYAANTAKSLKDAGIKIYSVGVGLHTFGNSNSLDGVQYIEEQLKRNDAKTIDTSGKTNRDDLLVIKAGSFENWLRTAIGSNYYVDGTASDLDQKYQDIFSDLKQTSITNSANLWTVTDPVPETMEFIAFKDENNTLQSGLTGSLIENGEDTASINSSNLITWDLKKSGYSKEGEMFVYSVSYRVRLKNEQDTFVEETSYQTNDETYLTYNMITTGSDGSSSSSEKRTLSVNVPAVKGYLGDLEFTKQDQDGNPLDGAVFTLSHDTVACNKCRGDNETSVMVGNMTATSDENGKVKFTNIPSGHFYTLEETGIPNGYAGDATKYSITVAYDAVTVKKADGTATELNAVTNTALETTTEIGGTKQLTNPDGAEHTFTFELVEVADRNGTEKQGAEPEQKTVTFDTNTNGNELIFTFNNLIYKGSDLENKSSKIYYYKVSEVNSDSESLNADENFYIVEVKVELNTDKTALTATKTIYKNGTDSVDSITFENTLLGSLTLSKQIVGTYPQGETFTFTLQGLPDGVYSAALNGESTTVTVANGLHTVKLGHKESLVIYGIPHGTKVTVTEAKSAYTVRYLVNSSWMQRNGNTVTTGVTTSGTEILFKNYSPYGLPQTGQLNWPIALLAVLGLGCIGGGALMLRRKKGKHEK